MKEILETRAEIYRAMNVEQIEEAGEEQTLLGDSDLELAQHQAILDTAG